MANLQRILGTMLLSRMGSRGAMGGAMGGALGTAALMGLGGRRGGLGRKAGLAALAYLAYRAYQDRGRAAPGAAAGAEAGAGQQRTLGGTIGGIIDSLTGPARGGEAGGGDARPSLGDRIGDAFGGREPAAAPAEGEVSDGRALLLIRAMITAANSDGRISEDERRRILAKLDEDGADADDRRTVERELANPVPLEDLLREVRDEDTAQQFYLASRVAVEGETGVQKSYLEFLRQRLALPEEDVAEVDQIARG